MRKSLEFGIVLQRVIQDNSGRAKSNAGTRPWWEVFMANGVPNRLLKRSKSDILKLKEVIRRDFQMKTSYFNVNGLSAFACHSMSIPDSRDSTRLGHENPTQRSLQLLDAIFQDVLRYLGSFSRSSVAGNDGNPIVPDLADYFVPLRISRQVFTFLRQRIWRLFGLELP